MSLDSGMGATNSTSRNSDGMNSIVVGGLNGNNSGENGAQNSAYKAAAAAVDHDTSGFLEYPRDFFDEKCGANPATNDDAAKLWAFRLNRPPKGGVDHELPNGEGMMREVKIMRQNLRGYISNCYLDDIRISARKNGMMLPTTNTHPITIMDFKTIITQLPNTPENNKMVWDVFHKPFRDRLWLANHVDQWFFKNRMILMNPPAREHKEDGEKTSKFYTSDRGGFGAVARQAKAEVIKGYMGPMLNKAKWNIASSNRAAKNIEYTKVNMGEDSFYICTKKEGEAVAGKKVNKMCCSVIIN